MPVFKNRPIQGFQGKNIKISRRREGSDIVEMVEGNLSDILMIILNNAPLNTQQDSINGMRLAEAIDKAKDEVEIGELVHEWLKPIAEKLTPVIFRINGNIVYKHICEGLEKPNKETDV